MGTLWLNKAVLVYAYAYAYQGYRQGTHSPYVWSTADATNEAATQDDGGDEVDLCALCFVLCAVQKHATTLRGEGNENSCAACIDPHAYGNKTVKVYDIVQTQRARQTFSQEEGVLRYKISPR